MTSFAQPLFSVVVPVYNAEPFLRECLDSVLRQSCRSFEVICVDDGSTDGSSVILDEFQERYGKIRVLHKGNQGVSSARNKGLEIARGRYVLFLDADDYIADESLRQIAKAIKAHNPDIVVFGGASVPSSFWDNDLDTRNVVYRNDSFRALLKEKGSRPLIAGKCYRLDLLRSHRVSFDCSLDLGEDQAFQFASFPYAETIVFIDAKCYFYRQHQGNSMSGEEAHPFAKLMKHVKLANAILKQQKEAGFLVQHELDLAKWLLDFLWWDTLSLPNLLGRDISSRFTELWDTFFPDLQLDSREEGMLEALRSIGRDKTPVVSIVVPVYNAEKYLLESFKSLCRQSMKDFELIYVDDGSTDGSCAILGQFEKLDTRVRVFHQNHLGAGLARNRGADFAIGEYIIFLDADDLFDFDMLEIMLSNARQYDSDICVCRARGLDSETGALIPQPWTCDTSHSAFVQPFSRATETKMIYCFTTPAPWNKLFKKSFVDDNGLRFQSLPNSNDAYFTILALSLAARVSTVDKELMSYRINNSGSLQGSKHRHPLAFFSALRSIRESLIDRGIYSDLETPFSNFAFDCCAYNLWTCAMSKGGSHAFEEIYHYLKSEGLALIDLLNKDEDSFYVYTQGGFACYSDFLKSNSAMEFAELRRLPPFDVIDKRDEEIRALKAEIEEIYASYSFRIGSTIVGILRRARDFFVRKKRIA